MRKEGKQAMVTALRELFDRAQVAIVADFRGLKVSEETTLRRRCRDAGVHYKVVKNTLARLAVEGTPFEPMLELLNGPSALALSDEDPSAPAKVIAKFQKEFKKLDVRGGLIRDSQVPLSSAEVGELALLPGKDELRAQLLGVLIAVPQNFVRALNDAPSRLARVIDAYRNKKEEQAA
ncbi:MAG: 50S ribosomal protein L10 [Deltaproteobacteria bacterium]|nr:50S ribosomal protein L10 [Deltaproteobacteria bacterium]